MTVIALFFRQLGRLSQKACPQRSSWTELAGRVLIFVVSVPNRSLFRDNINMTGLQDDWYQNAYNEINASARKNSIFFKVPHREIERIFTSNYGLKILEIGCNKGEHVEFVRSDWRDSGSYVATDIRDLEAEDLQYLSSVGVLFKKEDVEQLSFSNCEFDRVIVTCVLHHLTHPIKGLQEIRRVTKIGGQIDILLPNDPGIMYRFLRHFTTLRKAKKANRVREVELIHALEHRNHFLSISKLAEETFKNDVLNWNGYPFSLNLYNLNAFTILRVKRTSAS